MVSEHVPLLGYTLVTLSLSLSLYIYIYIFFLTYPKKKKEKDLTYGLEHRGENNI